MTSRTTSRPSAPHSASSNQVEERLRARRIGFAFEPNLRVDEVVAAEGHQVRLTEHRAPAEMVTRYAEQMKAGAVFPAIVVNDRGELIDGNSRRLASIKAGRDVIAAYICVGLTDLEARSLSVELNQCHGLSMTEEEIHTFVTGAVHEGQTLDTRSYARMTGVRASTLSRWMSQANFQVRARRAGIADAQIEALSDSAQAILNGVRLVPVLVELTSLTVSARVPIADLRRLVTSVNAASSEVDALGVVRVERDARHDDIRAIASGFAAHKSRGHRSAMHIAALLNLAVDDLLDVRPERQDETVMRLRSLRDHLDRAVSRADLRWGSLEVDCSTDLEDRPQEKLLCHPGAGRG